MKLSAFMLFEDEMEDENLIYSPPDEFADIEPVDVNESMDILDIEFGKSTSKNYKKAVKLAEQLPNYSFDGEHHRCHIDTVLDGLINISEISTLLNLINKWKSTKYKCFGEICNDGIDFYYLRARLRKMGGKYGVLADNWREVSNGAITVEPLPLKTVYYPGLYGSFFAFAEDIGEDLYFCECERKGIENYLSLRRRQPLRNYVGSKTYPLAGDVFPPTIATQSQKWDGDIMKHIRFKPKICFKCNSVVPKKKFCDPMYGGNFKQRYGWYVRQEFWNLGIDRLQLGIGNVMEEQCTPEIYDRIQRFLIQNKDVSYVDDYELKHKLETLLEDSVREKMGFRKIGEAWVSETILFQIVEALYPDETVIRHHRPDWLEGLELDAYVPGMKLALEYQGIQHFKAVDHWGGEKQLKIQQEHDKRKKQICDELGITLVCIDYDEPLNSDYVQKKIVKGLYDNSLTGLKKPPLKVKVVVKKRK